MAIRASEESQASFIRRSLWDVEARRFARDIVMTDAELVAAAAHLASEVANRIANAETGGNDDGRSVL